MPEPAPGTEAAAEAFARLGGRLYRYTLAILGSPADAEEIVQDLFLTLAETDGAAWPRDLDGWLLRSARNLSWRRLGRARRRREILKGAAPLLAPREAGDPDLEALAGRASEALKVLPVEQREAVALHLFEGMTFAEIGAAAGVPEDTAASRYRYGIAKLKEILR